MFKWAGVENVDPATGGANIDGRVLAACAPLQDDVVSGAVIGTYRFIKYDHKKCIQGIANENYTPYDHPRMHLNVETPWPEVLKRVG